MSESDKRAASELKDLMRRVLSSEACEGFERFMVRQLALRDMAPNADDALIEGIEHSPDGGDAMAEAHLAGLPEDERERLIARASREASRRLHAAALALLSAAGAAHLAVDVTPEMVAVAAITELGDSIPGERDPA